MSTRFRILSSLAAAAAVTTLAFGVMGEGGAPPKKTGRLAVAVNKVGKKAAVNQPLELRGRISWSGAKANFAYEWTSLGGPPLPPGSDPTAPSISYPVGTLEAGQHYHLLLKVTATVPGNEDEEEEGFTLEASEEVKFAANEAPRGGSCKASVKPVGAKSLQITLSAPGWTDPDGQVQYRFEILRGKRTLALQNWRLLQSFTAGVVLEPGETVIGRCGIRDQYGDGETMDTAPIRSPGPTPGD